MEQETIKPAAPAAQSVVSKRVKKPTLKQQKATALKELRRAIKEYKDFYAEIARCNKPF